jgi:nucleoside-diphosphate kinase
MERTYIMIKPDGVQRGLIGQIIARFEAKGFKLQAMKLFSPTRAHLEEHYSDLSSKGFFAGLIDYMCSGPVCCMVWEGTGAVKTGRVMLGATKPSDSLCGTIRGDFCIDVGRNICHGSDSVENAEKEIALWFPEGVCDWTSHSQSWIYE